MASKEITRGTDWILGDFEVEPPVPVVDTEFHTWEPSEDGRYPVQALHYSILHPIVLGRDNDIRNEKPYSSVGANNRALMMTYLRAARATLVNVVDEAGNRHPIAVNEVDEPATYEGKSLRLDTASMRDEASDFYQRVGDVAVTWEGEPPVIPCPVEDSRFFFPDRSSSSN